LRGLQGGARADQFQEEAEKEARTAGNVAPRRRTSDRAQPPCPAECGSDRSAEDTCESELIFFSLCVFF